MRYFKLVLSALWQAPVAIPVWVLYLLPAWGLGLIRLGGTTRDGYLPAAMFDVNPRVRWWAGLWENWAGHAMPFAIVTHILPGESRALVQDHELRHVRQIAALGPFCWVSYLLFLAEFGYKRHPLEVDADEHANGK